LVIDTLVFCEARSKDFLLFTSASPFKGRPVKQQETGPLNVHCCGSIVSYKIASSCRQRSQRTVPGSTIRQVTEHRLDKL